VHNQTTIDDEKRASAQADKLISRFRIGLSISEIWRQQAGTSANKTLRAGKLTLGIVDREFLQQQSDDLKQQLLFAEMDYYYLDLASSLACGRRKVFDSSPESCSRVLKKEYERLIGDSRYLNIFYGQKSLKGNVIKNERDLLQYLSELDSANRLLRKYLPKTFYELPSYKANQAQFESEKEGAARAKVERLDGLEFFGIPDEHPVVLVIRDIFMMYFADEGGEMKLVGFATSN